MAWERRMLKLPSKAQEKKNNAQLSRGNMYQPVLGRWSFFSRPGPVQVEKKVFKLYFHTEHLTFIKA